MSVEQLPLHEDEIAVHMQCFHGTGYSDGPAILRSGFDIEKCGQNKENYGALGKAIYFSTDFDLANSYGPFVITAEIDRTYVIEFKEACRLAGIDLPLDYRQLWDDSTDQERSVRIADAFLKAGIRAVHYRWESIDEVAVYDPSVITVTGTQQRWCLYGEDSIE